MLIAWLRCNILLLRNVLNSSTHTQYIASGTEVRNRAWWRRLGRNTAIQGEVGAIIIELYRVSIREKTAMVFRITDMNRKNMSLQPH